MNNKVNSWAECLAFWHEMSMIKDTYSIRQVAAFKNNILIRMGIGKKEFGCPFCEKYYRESDCPLGDCEYASKIFDKKPCFDTPYNNWLHYYLINNIHNQKFAKDFYNYLVELKIKEDENNVK